MIRLMGALLLAAGAFCIGLGAAAELRQRVRTLEALCVGLELMERELELRLTPLPQMMEELAQRTKEPARGLFEGCRCALEGLDQERFSAAWARLVEEMTQVPEDGRRAMYPLGQVLGRYDGSGQREAIAGVRRELEGVRSRMWEESERMGRVYRTLGATAGAFLVILLL